MYPQLGLTVSFSMPNRALPQGRKSRWGTSGCANSPGRKKFCLPGLDLGGMGKPTTLAPGRRGGVCGGTGATGQLAAAHEKGHQL